MAMDEKVKAQFEAAFKTNVSNEAEQTKKTDDTNDCNVDLYEENTIDEPIIKIRQLTAKKLCEIISAKFKSAITDYKGCTFRMTQNGMLEFVMVLENRPEAPGLTKVLQSVNEVGNGKIDQNSAAAYVLREKVNRAGRRTCTMNPFGQKFFKPFMNKTLYLKGNKYEEKPINWDQAMEEKEERTQSYYPFQSAYSYIVLKNISLDAIVTNMLTPTDIKEAETKKAAKNKNYVPQLQFRVNIKGFRYNDMTNGVGYSMVPYQVINGFNGPQMVPVQLFQNIPLDNLYLNIEEVDMKEARKTMPDYQMYSGVNANSLNIV